MSQEFRGQSMHKRRPRNIKLFYFMQPDGQCRQQGFAADTCAEEHGYSGCQLAGSCKCTGEWIWEKGSGKLLSWNGNLTLWQQLLWDLIEFVRGLFHPYDILVHITWKGICILTINLVCRVCREYKHLHGNECFLNFPNRKI